MFRFILCVLCFILYIILYVVCYVINILYNIYFIIFNFNNKIIAVTYSEVGLTDINCCYYAEDKFIDKNKIKYERYKKVSIKKFDEILSIIRKNCLLVRPDLTGLDFNLYGLFMGNTNVCIDYTYIYKSLLCRWKKKIN